MRIAYGLVLTLALILVSLAAVAVMPPSSLLHGVSTEKDKARELREGRELLESLKNKVVKLELWFDKQREEQDPQPATKTGDPMPEEKP